MATNRIYCAIALIGGTAGALDSIAYSVLSDGDLAIVSNSSEETHVLRFESSSAGVESSPQIIKPDDAAANNGRWILTDVSMEDLKVYGASVLDGALTVAGLVTAATLKAGSGATVTTIEDSDTLGTSDTKLCTQGNTKEYVENALTGLVVRPTFTHVSDTSISMSSFRYHHDGTTQQEVKIESSVTFILGSGGSNSGSTDLGASEQHYIYLDDTAIITQGASLLDADCFINNKTAPTWSHTKNGLYNGADRCIFAVSTDGSSDILEFTHSGDAVYFADMITSVDSNTLGTSWTDLAMDFPGFCTRGIATFYYRYVDTTSAMYWRTNGQTGTTGHACAYVSAASAVAMETLDVVTDSAQKIEIKASGAGTEAHTVYTQGWYFPEGM
jgi:hypothetical protein